jgi:hypothetical protein
MLIQAGQRFLSSSSRKVAVIFGLLIVSQDACEKHSKTRKKMIVRRRQKPGRTVPLRTSRDAFARYNHRREGTAPSDMVACVISIDYRDIMMLLAHAEGHQALSRRSP